MTRRGLMVVNHSGWLIDRGVAMGVHMTWQNVILTTTQKTESKHKGSTVENTTPESATGKAPLDLCRGTSERAAHTHDISTHVLRDPTEPCYQVNDNSGQVRKKGLTLAIALSQDNRAHEDLNRAHIVQRYPALRKNQPPCLC